MDIVPERTRELRLRWDQRDMPIALRILEAPYREQVRPVMDYVGRLHRNRPRDVIVVYVPEYIGNNRFRFLARDRVRDRLRSDLLRTQGVMVVTVPWQGKGVRPADSNPHDHPVNNVARDPVAGPAPVKSVRPDDRSVRRG